MNEHALDVQEKKTFQPGEMGELQGSDENQDHLIEKGTLRFSGENRLSLLADWSIGAGYNLLRRMSRRIKGINNPQNKRGVRFALSRVLANCIVCARYQENFSEGTRIVVVYPRMAELYRPSTRGEKTRMSLAALIRVLAELERLEYIGQKVGIPLGGWRSSFWPLEKLLQELDSGEEGEIAHARKDSVVLMDQDKEKEEFRYTRDRKKIRRAVRQLNRNNARHTFELRIPETRIEKVYGGEKEEEGGIEWRVVERKGEKKRKEVQVKSEEIGGEGKREHSFH
jgi:hypothetical protein